MSENRAEGAFQNVAGKAQDAVGGLTGDTKTQAEGKARQVFGKVQSAYGEAADQASDLAASASRSVEQQPLMALLISGVVGYMLGWLMHRR
jgi:uncharacterized protein YjbJ (UPF0337 family)